MAKKKDENGTVEFPVRWGNVSVGEDTVRIALSIGRNNITPGKADALLCGRRLTLSLSCVPKGADPDQPSLVEVGREFDGVADVKSVKMTRKAIGGGLTFALADVNLDTICHFAKRDGRIVINKVEDLDDGHDEDADEGSDD